MITDDLFFLGSEAGSFEVDAAQVITKGTLQAGGGLRVLLETGEVHFRDPSYSRENKGFRFNPTICPAALVAPAGRSRGAEHHGLVWGDGRGAGPASDSSDSETAGNPSVPWAIRRAWRFFLAKGVPYLTISRRILPRLPILRSTICESAW